jgi:hypothetical protein
MYYGTIRVPGVFDGDWRRDCGGNTCDQSAKHIQDINGVPFTIPRDGATRTNGPRNLTLGFTDDVYRDNGYSGHDDGTNDQCRNVGNAFVDVTIERATSCAPQQPQQSDGVKDGDESDVDCGGTRAPKCADNKHCTSDADCASNMCASSGVCLPKITCTTGSWQRLHIATQVCKVLARVTPDHDACGSKITGSVPAVGLSPSSVTGPGVQIIRETATDQDGNGSVDVEACVGCGGVNIQYQGFTPWGYEGLVCTDLFHGPQSASAPPAHPASPPPPPPPPPAAHPPPPPPPHGGARTQQR